MNCVRPQPERSRVTVRHGDDDAARARTTRSCSNWKYVLATTNPPPGAARPGLEVALPDPGRRAADDARRRPRSPGCSRSTATPTSTGAGSRSPASGIVLAHMANNLMNDLFDLEVGTDREDYPRNLYSPHPVLSGVDHAQAASPSCALVVNAICLAIMIVLTVARGWPIVAFALGGFLLSAAYTAPPLRLKKHGLGEPTVLVVWGPLMVGGTYYAATGTIPGAVVLASLPYAMLCTTVLMGKHIDKIPWDAPDGTHTLPVILGEARGARASRRGCSSSSTCRSSRS